MGSSVFSDLAVHHVEFHVTDAVWAARELAAQYGFAVVGSRRDEDHVSVALRQGSTVLVVTEGLTDAHPASLYVQQHGDLFHTFHLHAHRWADNRTGMLEGPADPSLVVD
ncbi:hypothetical protein ACIBTX_11130, partial [Micromonospora sp. NPDC049359]